MHAITAKCSCCGREETYLMNEEEYQTLLKYQCYRKQLGLIQDLFPEVPA